MSFLLKTPVLVIFSFLLLTIASIWAVFHTPMDALPDLSENQVIVMTEWNGQNPQNIEDQVTYPLTVSLQSLAGVKTVRGMSQMGVSMVTVIFEDSVDFYFARNQVFEKLSQIQNQLPEGVNPVLGPDATGLGHIFMYELQSDTHSLSQLRTIQDYIVSYELQSIKGVSEIAPIGGEVKIYKVLLDPYKMEQLHITISEVLSVLKDSNNNVSGKVISSGKKEIAVQGIGFFESFEDIENIPIKTQDGESILLSYIGEVVEDSQFRRGILADTEKETVGAIVVMRQGENPLSVIELVEEKIPEIENLLPEGVKIVPFYDRTNLIMGAVETLRDVLVLEILITILVLGLFLWHIRSSIMVAISLSISILLTFLLMYLFQIPLNIMSLGGIAIAIGTMVDAIVVITEDVYSRSAQLKIKNKQLKIFEIIQNSLKTVTKPLTFAIFIIILSFLPILFLEETEGKLFHPLAWTNIFAMISALFVAIFLVPVFCLWGIKGKLFPDEKIPINNFFINLYTPILKKSLKYKKTVLVFTGGIFLVAAIIFPNIQSEFMPELDEGALMYMPVTFPDISEKTAKNWLIETNKILSEIPEVEKVVGKAGRAKTATDPAPLSMFETFVTLKPKNQWRKEITKKDIVQEIYKKIRIEGLANGVTQPIIGRIGMMSTGIRSQVGIKIYGDDPEKLENFAMRVSNLLGENIPGTYGNAAVQTMGLEYLNIDIQEKKLAEFGISKSDVLNTITAGVGGMQVTTLFQGRERIGLEVQIQEQDRKKVEDIENILVHKKGVSTVRLKDIAKIEKILGPAVIRSEKGKIYAVVQTDVQGVGLVDYVNQAKNFLEENLELPQGYSIEWTGQYENQVRAKNRLLWIVPATIILIFFLLYFTYQNIRLVSIVMIAIPLGITGGIISLFLTDYNFSVAVWVGFIALFGNVVETGMVMVMYLEESVKNNPQFSLLEAVHKGAIRRLRPILMTAFTSVLGLLPLLFTTGIGSEVQKPLAVVVTGGLATSLFLTLIVIPVLFMLINSKKFSNNKVIKSSYHHIT